ncbi:hypothetical protein QYF36_000204 [Acer negundo]|nr:hypothetical protein QYF36_000204 [Acer negundo]
MVLNQFSNADKAHFVLVNTFYNLEQEVVDSMSKFCPLLTIGPTMALDQNAKTFLYSDHEGWINTRINSKSRQHCDILSDIDEVLGRLHVSEGFKQGPFGHYLGLHFLVTIHGNVLHSILKRQIKFTTRSANASPPRDDEMWFGLGMQQYRFGQVEFCLCSGLKMGKL